MQEVIFDNKIWRPWINPQIFIYDRIIPLFQFDRIFFPFTSFTILLILITHFSYCVLEQKPNQPCFRMFITSQAAFWVWVPAFTLHEACACFPLCLFYRSHYLASPEMQSFLLQSDKENLHVNYKDLLHEPFDNC